MSLSSAAEIPPYSGRTEPDWLPALKTIQTGLPNGRKVLTDRIWTFAGETKAKDIIMPYLKTAKKYDIIVVDGKRRADCARTALKALNQGGIIILDDSDRINTSKEYADAVASLKNGNLIQVDFYGFCPMNVYTKTTSVFLSRDFNFQSLYSVQPINGFGNLWSMSRKDRKEFYKANK